MPCEKPQHSAVDCAPQLLIGPDGCHGADAMFFLQRWFGGRSGQPDDEYQWRPCEPPIFPRRTVDGGKTLLKCPTWRRRGKDGKWQYIQKPQVFEEWETDQW